MFSKNNIKYYVLFFLVFGMVNLIFAQDDNVQFYGIISNIILKKKGFNPVIYSPAGEPTTAKINDKFLQSYSLLTTESQQVEIEIFDDLMIAGMLKIEENTNISYTYDTTNDTLLIRVPYGRIRCVVKPEYKTKIILQTVTINSVDSDFGVTNLQDDNGVQNGSIIVFGNKVNIQSIKDKNNSENPGAWQICDFRGSKVYPPYYFYEDKLTNWKNSMIFKSSNKPRNLNYVLETLEYKPHIEVITDNKKQRTTIVKDSTTDLHQDVTSDKIVKNKFDYKKFFSSFLSLEAGSIVYDGDIAVKFVSTPGINLFDNKFEFGFYLSLNFVPSKLFSGNWAMSINNGNNEWSFGTDQNNNTAKIVWDVFDDILLKLRVLRYNTIQDKIFVNFGDYFNISDFYQYSLVDFNSKIFFPRLRKSSFVTKINVSYFEWLFYAEDVLPRGIYGTEIMLKTPSKSFRFRFKLSGYIDAYNLIKFDGTESSFPGQFNTAFIFEPFNLPSFGFSFYLSGGILIPFTYNMQTGTSNFNTLLSQNPAALAANTSGNIGFFLRLTKFSFSGEFILDSGLNKIGLYDTSYLATRDNRNSEILSWMTDKASKSTIDITDFNFGFRTRMNYKFLKYVLIELSYQLTFPVYYDKLHFKIQLDSIEKWKVNFAFYFQWQIESLINAFSSTKAFQESNFMYIGFYIKPHKSVEIGFVSGVYPNYITASDPWYSSFIFDFYVKFKPLSIKKNDLKRKKKKFLKETQKN